MIGVRLNEQRASETDACAVKCRERGLIHVIVDVVCMSCMSKSSKIFFNT